MKHRKMEHRNRISRCRDYLQGTFDLNDSLCWFIHEQQENKEAHEQVFNEAQESIPPDHGFEYDNKSFIPSGFTGKDESIKSANKNKLKLREKIFEYR